MEEVSQSNRRGILNLIFFIISFVLPLILSVLLKTDIGRMLGIVIISSAFGLITIFVKEKEILLKRLSFNTFNDEIRLYILICICLVLSALMPFVKPSLFPMVAIYVLIYLFSNELMSIVSATYVLALSLLFCNCDDYLLFLTFFVSGTISVVLFSSLEKNQKAFNISCISIAIEFVLLCLWNVFRGELFNTNTIVCLILNIIICAAIFFVGIRYIRYINTFKNGNNYIEILDPEYELMQFLKNYSLEQYDKALYVSVLCYKAAEKIGINPNVLKACGYYYRIGQIRGTDSFENTKNLLCEYNIPEEVSDIINEFFNHDGFINSREASLLYMADGVITAISNISAESERTNTDYDNCINDLFDEKLKSDLFIHSSLSFEDIYIIKETFCGQHKIYDLI